MCCSVVASLLEGGRARTDVDNVRQNLLLGVARSRLRHAQTPRGEPFSLLLQTVPTLFIELNRLNYRLLVHGFSYLAWVALFFG